MRDGAQGNHFGYAYIAAECRPIKPNYGYCPTNYGSLSVGSPSGYAWYKWTRSSNPSWIIEGSNKYYIQHSFPLDGEIITCQMTSGLDTNYTVTVNTEFTYPILNADFVIDSYDTCSRTATFADLSTVTNCAWWPYKHFSWEIINTDSVMLAFSTDSLFTYTFPDPDGDSVEYLVRLLVDGCGCSEPSNGKWKEERNITIYPACDPSGVLNTTNSNSPIVVYPNPTSTRLYVQLALQETADYTLYNVVGQIMMQDKLLNSTFINIESLPEGIYYLKIIGKENGIVKFVKIN